MDSIYDRGEDRNLVFYTGFYIMLVVATVLILTSSLMFVNIGITQGHFIGSLIIATMMLYYVLYKTYKQQTVGRVGGVLMIFIIILIVQMAISHFMKDFSYDGNMYHKMGVVAIKDGWNAAKESVLEFNKIIDNTTFVEYDSYSLWVDHYAKGPWMFAATLYKLVESIEASKVLNLLVMTANICLAFDYLNKRYFNKVISSIMSVLLAVTPVTIVQVFSYYVDGLLANTVYILILALIMITDKKYKVSILEKKVLLISTILLIVNIKFTGLGLGAVFCFAYYILWLIKAARQNNFKQEFIRWTLFFIVAVILGVGVIGGNCYIKNTIDHQHPFYPLFGKDKIDIMTTNQPHSFAYKSGPEKLFIATFGESANIYAAQGNEPIIKIPFLFNREEIKSFTVPDTRIGGFGVWFGGILIISMVVLIINLIKLFQEKREGFWITAVLLGTITILLLGLGDSWWARYSPHMYIYIILAVILGMINTRETPKVKYYHILIGLISLNVTIVAIVNIGNHFIKSWGQNQIVKEIKANITQLDKELQVYIPDPNLMGALYNLEELESEYTIIKEQFDGSKDFYNGFIRYKLIDKTLD